MPAPPLQRSHPRSAPARRRRLAQALAALLLPLAMLDGCAQPPRPAAVAPDVQGGEVYVRRCASCHGVDGRGGGPVAPTLRTPPPDLTRLAANHGGRFPREAVLAVVTGETPVVAHGTREMPVWSRRFDPPSAAAAVAGLVSSRQLRHLLDHLESMQAP